MTEQFCQFTHEMMRATHWISKTTGEHLKLSAVQKIIWVQMIDRYNFFRLLGKEWFDSQEDIAFATGCDVSTVKAFIRLLVKHGYITVKRKRLRGFVSSNSYKIVASLKLHNKHASASAPVQSSSDVKAPSGALVVLEGNEAVIAPQEVAVQLVPVFEDVPLEAYIDTPHKTPVIVRERIRGFADTLDEEIKCSVPVLPRGLVDSSGESDPWG
ncbi:helix-turn-helix domain-containing protein [Pseudomonas sp. S2_F03]